MLTANNDMNIILPYSEMNHKAKGAAEYSVLNPDTSSLSASGRSKGALFVSATILIKNIKNNGSKGKIFIVLDWLVIIRVKLGVSSVSKMTVKIIKPMITS